MPRRPWLVGLIGALMVGCSGQEPPTGMTWIAVTGPADSVAQEELVLETSNRAWFGYGGVIGIEAATSLPVRLVGRESCRIYASFSAASGTRWVIRFAQDGSASVEDWTGREMDAGPALAERPASGCESGGA